MKNFIPTIFEEFFPFISFLKNQCKIFNQIQTIGASQDKIKEYSILSIDKLNRRLSEEHDRAIKIDEKTVKFTLGLSVSLTILSAVSGTLAKLLPDNNINLIIIFLCGLSSVFMLIAGIISLGALKTLPKYGYGTTHEIHTQKNGVNYLASVLLLQEDINIVRHLRNEAAYQCIRNGFLLLLVALIISIFLIRIPIEIKSDLNSSKRPITIEIIIGERGSNNKKIEILDTKVIDDSLRAIPKDKNDNKTNAAKAKSRAAD